MQSILKSLKKCQNLIDRCVSGSAGWRGVGAGRTVGVASVAATTATKRPPP